MQSKTNILNTNTTKYLHLYIKNLDGILFLSKLSRRYTVLMELYDEVSYQFQTVSVSRRVRERKRKIEGEMGVEGGVEEES